MTDPQSYHAQKESYFQFLADLGLTKHIGSMQATQELVALCRIGAGTTVLDVGCGVGATPSYLARKHGCRVVGVDLLPKMIAQAQARARVERLEDRAAFVVADARDLPFADGLFDAVIAESVNVFFTDKRKALRESVRVTRPGGWVGITEMTWLRTPLPETVEYYRRVVFAESLEAAGWRELLESVGLQDVAGSAYRADLRAESRGRFERYGCRGIGRALVRTLTLFARERAPRALLKQVAVSMPKDLLDDMGYGVYAGRKAS